MCCHTIRRVSPGGVRPHAGIRLEIDPLAIESAFRRIDNLERHRPRPSSKRRPFWRPSASETAHPFVRISLLVGVNPLASSFELDRELSWRALRPTTVRDRDAYDRRLPDSTVNDDEHPSTDGSQSARADRGARAFHDARIPLRPPSAPRARHCPPCSTTDDQPLVFLSRVPMMSTPWERTPSSRAEIASYDPP